MPMAQNVKVVTDSTADIPADIRAELGIEMVPLKVHIGGETFLDNVTIQPTAFYESLSRVDKLPTTSQPTPHEFVEMYRKVATDAACDIVSIHLSQAMSGTYQSAAMAKEMLAEEGADFAIEVVNGKKASFATGLIVVAAAEAARAGKTLAECRALVERLIDETETYFMVDTLKYLQMGGRIAKASAFLGTLLNIKPILTLDSDGEVAPEAKARGKKRARKHIFDKLHAYAGDEPVRIGLMHAMVPEEAKQLRAMLEEQFNVEQLIETEIGSVIGTHVGPGTVAITIVKSRVVTG